MTYKREMDTTDNPSVYKKAQRRVLAEQAEIKCPLCPPHKNENFDGQKRMSKPKKNDHR